MPRYINVDTYTFVDQSGNSYTLKERREIPDQTIAYTINIHEGDQIDEIATRRDVYGVGSEGDSHKIFDANLVDIVESKFDLSKLRTLKIPI